MTDGTVAIQREVSIKHNAIAVLRPFIVHRREENRKLSYNTRRETSVKTNRFGRSEFYVSSDWSSRFHDLCCVPYSNRGEYQATDFYCVFNWWSLKACGKDAKRRFAVFYNSTTSTMFLTKYSEFRDNAG